MVRNSLREKFEFDGVPLRLLVRYKGQAAAKAGRPVAPSKQDSAPFLRRQRTGGSHMYGKRRQARA